MNVTALDGSPLSTAALPTDGFQLGVLLRVAYFSLRRCGNAHFGPFEANGEQFVLLKLLADDGPLSQLDLVRRGGYDPSTTTNMLKQLELRGHISREPNPDDGRSKVVRLTAAGRAQHKKLWNAASAVRKQLWDCVRPEDRQVFGDTLRRIVQTMETTRYEHESNRDER